MKRCYLIFLTFFVSTVGLNSIASGSREPYKKIKDYTLYINSKCVRVVKKEKYIPGTYFSPGYVKYWKEHIPIRCPNKVKYRSCFILKYNEEYIPGNDKFPGYVKSWQEEVSVPCDKDESKSIPNKLIRKSRRSAF